MDKLKKALGYSDPLGQSQIDPLTLQRYQQQAIQAQNVMGHLGLGAQNMAGGAGHVGHGMANAYNSPQTDAFLLGVIANTKVKVRNHIANEVEKMAEEIGAPTLLHAVVLAIRTMEIPE